jgi:hypothetical protein
MRFQLEPDNRGASDADLLDDLRKVATLLGKNFVTRDEYEGRGRFSSSTVQKRLGSWCKAHELAGLERIRYYNSSPKECLESLRRVADRLGKTTLTTVEYRSNGGLSLQILNRHFGSWKAALKLAGLTVSTLFHERASREELFENIERLWETLGRQPKTSDFAEPLSYFSCAPYKSHFGSLRKALEAFVESFENSLEEPEDGATQIAPLALPSTIVQRHKTGRGISWRMRFLVMRRDNFKCKIDGCSPATQPGTVLEVDHVVPWDAGGETVMENLQTLCQRCNSGKSNLPMREG